MGFWFLLFGVTSVVNVCRLPVWGSLWFFSVEWGPVVLVWFGGVLLLFGAMSVVCLCVRSLVWFGSEWGLVGLIFWVCCFSDIFPPSPPPPVNFTLHICFLDFRITLLFVHFLFV